MRTKTTVQATAYVVGYVWSVAIGLSGLQLPHVASKILSFVPLALALAFTGWDKYLWHVQPFVKFGQWPDLRGTWFGEFDSVWMDAERKPHQTSGPSVLVITQSYTKLTVKLVAEKSSSYSTAASLVKLDSGEYRLAYQYTNTPNQDLIEQLPAHQGSTSLLISSVVAVSMIGGYWTNRLSRGSLKLALVSRTRAADLDAARELAGG